MCLKHALDPFYLISAPNIILIGQKNDFTFSLFQCAFEGLEHSAVAILSDDANVLIAKFFN